MSRTRRLGFSDEIGSWKIICMARRARRSSGPSSAVRCWPRKPHVTRRRPFQLHDRSSGRGLPAARLSHHAERLAGGDVEADARDRVHRWTSAAR